MPEFGENTSHLEKNVKVLEKKMKSLYNAALLLTSNRAAADACLYIVKDFISLLDLSSRYDNFLPTFDADFAVVSSPGSGESPWR